MTMFDTPVTDAAGRTRLVIGTRGSKLALWQSNYVAGLIRDLTGLPVELDIIKTTGDKITDVPLARVGGKGLFTKEIELALLDGSVDLAVHSMKDVPTELPDGCILAGMPAREDARDVVVSGRGYNLLTLPAGGTVGTSSLRRVAQVRALRPDVEIVDVRGNLDTRMRKAEDGAVDVVILAAAGIRRMGWGDRITDYIPTDQMVSAVGQGAIGIEIRSDDPFMATVCAALSDTATLTCVRAERVVMNRLEGGCQIPIGAYCRYRGTDLILDAMVGSVDGTRILRSTQTGAADTGEALALAAVAELRAAGADDILATIRND
ncbi:MAG: hydroxymethylbilane synthase [Actinomycetes bacterium]|nr:hydroxymethylbilane synthase [Actinomycetes bacterium]